MLTYSKFEPEESRDFVRVKSCHKSVQNCHETKGCLGLLYKPHRGVALQKKTKVCGAHLQVL